MDLKPVHNSTADAHCCVAPVLAPSSTSCTLSRCEPEAPGTASPVASSARGLTLLQWDKDLPSYLQQGPILSQKEGMLCCDAVALLEAARMKASEITEKSKQEFETQKKKGYEQGLQEGKTAAAAHNIKTVLASLDYFEQSQHELVEVVISCVRRFVMELPAEERFYQLVGQALEELKQQPRIILQVNPKDRDAVEAALPRLQKLMPSGSTIEVRTREELSLNSCILESPLGLVDASLESQLAILETSLAAAASQQ